MADILGSKRAFENLIGTAGDDRIFGLGGAEAWSDSDTERFDGRVRLGDQLFGGGGNDLIVGGEGVDVISDDDDGSGKYGNDTIFAGGGDDVINLYGGADTVDGGEGDDDKVYLHFQDNPASLTVTFDPATGTFRSSTGVMLVNVEHVDVTGSRTGSNNLTGGNGNDRLVGGASNDTLAGGKGDDKLYSGSGNDTLDGGDGNDTLDGGAGDDWLFGGDGDDWIYDGLGNDTIFAGDGNDSIALLGGVDTVDGGAGDDRVELRFEDSLTVTFDAATGTFRSSTGVVLVNVERIDVTGSRTGPNNLTGGNGNDRLIGGKANDMLTGGKGNDTLNGGAGDDQIVGGDGNDTIGDDNGLYTYPDSYQDAPYGNDTILAGDGDDTITLHGGKDAVDGGAGDDRVRIYFGEKPASLTFTFDAATGSFRSSTGTTLTNVEHVELDASRGVDRLEGGKGNDRFNGLGQGDSVDGGAGEDLASLRAGGAGNFTVTFNAATRAFRTSEGTVLTNVEHIDVTGSSTGINNLTGGIGNDSLTGGQKSDTLVGGNGDDALNGGGGDDRLLGGEGNDRITDDIYGLTYGNDTILAGDGDDAIVLCSGADMVDGGAGDDTVRLELHDKPTDLTVTFDAATGTFQFSNGVILMNVEHIEFWAYSGTGTTWLEGGNGNDRLVGGLGDGFLFGGKGNDTLHGGSGNDVIDGGDGDDFIKDIGGENTLTGGAGADVFGLIWAEWGPPGSSSFITDFSVADDKIALMHPENMLVLAGRDFFQIGSAYTNGDQRILYNPETGMLSYDRDGNGSLAAVELAQLDTGLALTAAHFVDTYFM